LCTYVCRYCRGDNVDLLPSSLQPTSVEHRPHGLRTRVIRALYHVYPRFSNTVLLTHPTIADPQQLVGLRCVLAWQEPVAKPSWKFYFKFRRGFGRSACPLTINTESNSSQHRLLAPANVLHNPEERCLVLVVTTPHFLPLPVVMGQVLVKASSAGSIFSQSLRLTFSSAYVHRGNRSDLDSSVVAHFDEFVTARVMPWWHPNYPHRN